MPSKLDSFERKCQQAYDQFLETKRAELEAAVTRDQHKVMQDRYLMLKTLCSDLGHAYVSNSEYQALAQKAAKTAEDIKTEVAEKVANRVEELQKQLDHELEKRNLLHRLETASLQEEVKLLRNGGVGVASPAVSAKPVEDAAAADAAATASASDEE